VSSAISSAVGVAASGVLVGGVTGVAAAWATVASGCHGGPVPTPVVSRLVVGMGAGGPAGLKSAGSCDAADVPSFSGVSSAGPHMAQYGPYN
jgi:hypothetical protein